MTVLRRSIFAFVAVCLAFAGGVAIGNGPLQGTTPVRDDVSLAHAKARFQAQLAQQQRRQAFALELGRSASAALVADQLKNTSVAIFVLPGVPGSAVTGVSQAVAAAGAEIVSTGHLTRALVDASKKTYVDSVATNSMQGVKDLAASQSLPTYGRIGALLARAYTGPANALAVDDEAGRIDAQLRGAKLVTLRAPLPRRAGAVIVLAADDHGGDDALYARDQIELQVVDALAGGPDGLVVAAPAVASEPGGLIATITGAATTNALTTLNVLDSSAGRVATVGALAAAIDGHPGAYGVVSGEVVVPPTLE